MLSVGIRLADAEVNARKTGRLASMGSTVAALALDGPRVVVGHVGDSRVYRIRNNEIKQLTEDHSLLNDYLKMRKLTEEEIANFPHKNVIVRALGMKEIVKVDSHMETPLPGDLFLLCSDGLSGPVTDEDMLQIVDEHRADLKTAASRLIARANENGGPDNITCCLVRWPPTN